MHDPLRASYTGHYRRGLIALLEVLEFRSNNTRHRPVIDALALIRRYAAAGNLTYYPLGESVPTHRGTTGDWSSLIYRTDTRGRDRVTRMVYEVATFQALRAQLRCKEIWVVGADSWRNPEQDLPADFEQRRAENYPELRNRWTRACSSSSCAPRWSPPWTSWIPRYQGWTGWRSPTAPPGRSA